MHAQPSISLIRIWRQTLSVAATFWTVCLVLVALEARMGSNFVLGGVFFLSIPMLVAFTTWATKDVMFVLHRRFSAIVLLGVCVLLTSTLIVLIGLLAAANLKTLMIGA